MDKIVQTITAISLATCASLLGVTTVYDATAFTFGVVAVVSQAYVIIKELSK